MFKITPLLFLILSLLTREGYAQIAATNYSFARTSGTFATIAATGTAIATSGTGVLSDEGHTGGIPIGFTFGFCGTNYTNCTANSNPVLSLQNTNTASFTVATSNILGGGWLMPMWTDGDGRTGGGGTPRVYYQTAGAAGSRVFTIEWSDFGVFNQVADHMNWQIKLYEGSNVVQFVYGTNAASPTGAVGLANSKKDFQTVTNATANGVNSAFNSGVSLPTNGSVLTFTPPLPTVATATPVNLAATAVTLGGSVTADGGVAVAERGIVWSTSANPTTANNKVANGSGIGAFSAVVNGLASGTTIHVRAYAINSAGTSYGSDLSFTTATPVSSRQVTHLAGTAVVGGISVNVTSTGGVTSFIPCGASTSPYYFTGGPASFTFNFSAPVGSVEVDAVFASAGTAGQLHFVRNGVAYAINDANLAGVTASTCGDATLAQAQNGDLVNTGDYAGTPNNRVIIPGPITSLTVANVGANGAIFGLFLTPETYFQLVNPAGSSTVNGVGVTVTSSGAVTSFKPCGPNIGPYYFSGGAGSYTFSFGAAVEAVEADTVFGSGGTADQVHFAKNGAAYALTTANLAGVTASTCGDGTLAQVSGGDLVNTGDYAGTPNNRVIVSGSITSLTLSNVGVNAALFGLYFIKGTNAGLGFTNASNQSLTVDLNATATSINALLSVSNLNPGLSLTWTLGVAPLHGSVVAGGSVTSTGGMVTPTGFSYQPATGYGGVDGFTVYASDGVNTAATTILVNVGFPAVTTATPVNVAVTAATLGGSVTADGGGAVTERGIVWSTNINPTTANNKAANGSGTGAFSATVSSLPAATTIHARAYAINSTGTTYGSDLTFTTATPVSSRQVTHLAGTVVVGGISVTVASSGGVTSFSPCGASTAPYYFTGGSGSFTFNFSAPVGSVEVDAVFASVGTTGQLHFVRNGVAYAINDANLAGVTTSSCGDATLAQAQNGDLVNTGDFAGTPNNRVIIPGPITSLTVANVGANGAIFGLFLTPETYFQVLNPAGSSTVNGVGVTVTSIGSVSIFKPCGPNTGPYYFPGGAGSYTFSFGAAVEAVEADTVFGSGGTADQVHFAKNGAAYALNTANLAGGTASNCGDATLAQVSGGDLVNTGDFAGTPNNRVIVPGSLTSLSVSNAGANAAIFGMYFTKGTNAGLSFADASNQSLMVDLNAAATPINALLAVSNLNLGLTLTWTLGVAPLHGSVVAGGSVTSPGGGVTPTGFTYQPNTGYGGMDGFTIYASDGVNTAATTILVNVALPTVTTATPVNLTSTAATLGGSVISDGGVAVTERGIVWSTSANPTTAANKVANGSGTGAFNATVTSLPAGTTIHVRAYAINSSGTSYGSDLIFTTAAPVSSRQVTHLAGTAVVGGIGVTVSSSGGVTSFTPCGASTAPYYFTGGTGSFTFNFSAPVGSVEVDAVFASAGTAGQLHFVRNGVAYAINDANLAGVTASTCGDATLAQAQNGDLVNTGDFTGTPNNRVIIPGPITSLTVANVGANGAIFGLFLTPETYFQVLNPAGSSTVNGVGVTVTSIGSGSISKPCGPNTGPYYFPGGAGSYTFSFGAAVDAVEADTVFGSVGTADQVHFAKNGAAYALTTANLAGGTASNCGDATLAQVSGGDLVNTGDYTGTPNNRVIIPGSLTSLTVSNVGANAAIFGMYFTKGTNAGLAFTNASNQNLTVALNAPATPINALLAVSNLNLGLTLTWTLGVAPLHGSVVAGGSVTSTGGGVTPTGFTYQPATGFSGVDGFTMYASDGVNTAATTILVNVGVPTVTTLAASLIGTTNATLHGLVNPNGLAAGAWFQFGATTNYGGSTSVSSVGSVINPQPVSALLTALNQGTLYHFRSLATNSAGTNFGDDLTFTTVAIPPPLLINLTMTNGPLKFAFTNTAGQPFTVLATTNLLLPLSNWSGLGSPIEGPAGQYQFSDPAATNNVRRFYRVLWP